MPKLLLEKAASKPNELRVTGKWNFWWQETFEKKKNNHFHYSSNWAEATAFGKNMCLYMVHNDRAHETNLSYSRTLKKLITM